MSHTRSSNVGVGVAVAGACAAMWITMGLAVTPLIVALAISFVLWAGREVWPADGRVMVAYATAVVVQCLHVVEEYRTGFFVAFPPLFGAEPWSGLRFLSFNLAWLAIFVVAGIGLARPRRAAYVVALFLAIGGGVGNGLGHLALAARRGGYFPGAYTGVLALVAGSALLRALLQSRRRIAVAA